jgi:hypothetical protein
VFVTGLGAMVAGSVVSRRARRSLGAALTAYSGAALAAAAKATPRRDPASILRIAAAFFALHAGYGVGMLRRLLSAARPGK